MATYNLTDIRKIRFLPIKQVGVKLSDNNVYTFSDLQEGASFDINPITTTDNQGNEIVVAYQAIIEFSPTQNNFYDLENQLYAIQNDNDLKGFSIWFNRNMAINSSPSGETLFYANYDDEARYNYATGVQVSYTYDNNMPLVKITIKSLMSVSNTINLWQQLSWATYSWT